LTWTTANALGYPSNLFRADNNNFGPRLGAAFKLTNKMVLRGGYGEYFWTMPLSQILQSSRNNPPLNLRFENNLYRQAVPANFPEDTYTLVSVPAADDFIPNAPVDIDGIVSLNLPASATLIDGRNWGDGRAQTWNFTLEREVLPETALRVSYIGTHGRDMEQQFEVNTQEPELNYELRTGLAPPSPRRLLRSNPNWSLIAINRTGYSNTHSGQIEIERRFANGIGFQWFYTYTRSLTTSDAPGFDAGNTSINSTGGGGRIPEVQQLWGTPNLNFEQRQRLVYFNSTNIPGHRIRWNAVYDLPFGRGKKFGTNASGAVNQIIGGWQIATIGSWRGGLWQSISPARYQFGSPRLDPDQRLEMDYQGFHQRLWFIGNINPASASNVTGGDLSALVPDDTTQQVVRQMGPNCSGAYNNNVCVDLTDRAILTDASVIPDLCDPDIGGHTCRSTPITELYNYSPRANIIGPGAWNVDMSVFKNFRIRERANIRFTADFFNAFNHPNDRPPNNVTGLQNLAFQDNDARIIQFSLRVDW
jgi:hypothetical protein